jgi:hypothetical protein
MNTDRFAVAKTRRAHIFKLNMKTSFAIESRLLVKEGIERIFQPESKA